MNEFANMSPFWQGWIIVLSVGNVLFCLWLILWTMKKRPGEAASGDVTGHTWDGDLQEYNNPLPRWWLWMFYATLVFGVIYYVLYPGLWEGVLGWSKESQYEREVAAADEKFAPIFAQYRETDIPELAQNDEALATGQRLYLTYCMQCHGSDAQGAKGFPNLADNDWLWGGSPKEIQATIVNGRNAVMPAHEAILGEEGIDEVANYVLTLSGQQAEDAALAEKGKERFTTICAACHMPDGTGNKMLGAPNLTDDTWLYGGDIDTIRETLHAGRMGQMPAFNDLLGEDKIHVLTAYVYSLSN
jgi:cytochrome c oxidase cbb3-type subunit III